MNYKILSMMLGVLCIVLSINIYKLNSAKTEQVQDCGHNTELEDLRFKQEQCSKQEDVLLKQNAYLVNENNELKQQLDSKPQIIYRNVQTETIDDAASQQYTDALQERYSPNH